MLYHFQVAAEVAAPLSQAKKITMVSSGQGDVGAAKLTGEVLDIVTKVPGLVKTMTGVDIVKVCTHLEIKSKATSTPKQQRATFGLGVGGLISPKCSKNCITVPAANINNVFPSVVDFYGGLC